MTTITNDMLWREFLAKPAPLQGLSLEEKEKMQRLSYDIAKLNAFTRNERCFTVKPVEPEDDIQFAENIAKWTKADGFGRRNSGGMVTGYTFCAHPPGWVAWLKGL